MYISPVRHTDPAPGAEDNATSPKGTGTAQVRPPAADGLPGHPSAPPLEPSSLPPRNSMLPGQDNGMKASPFHSRAEARATLIPAPACGSKFTSFIRKIPALLAKTACMQLPRAVAGQDTRPYLPTHADLRGGVDAIWSQLASHAGVIQRQDETPGPVRDATQPLQALQSLCAMLNAEQCAEMNEQLQTAIRASAHLPIDQKLLGEIVADVTRAPRKPLRQCLADKTFDALVLDKLQMKNDGEVEPGSLVYNSILPNLAGCTDDRGALCRTLLLEGVCHLFAGPQQERRRANFKTAIFDLNVGKSELPFELAADLKLEALNLYETVVNQP